MKQYTTTGRIISTRYKCTSASGNPCYYVTFKDGAGKIHEGQTAPDAASAYGINNPQLKEEGKAKFIFHVTAKGRIILDYILQVKE